MVTVTCFRLGFYRKMICSQALVFCCGSSQWISV